MASYSEIHSWHGWNQTSIMYLLSQVHPKKDKKAMTFCLCHLSIELQDFWNAHKWLVYPTSVYIFHGPSVKWSLRFNVEHLDRNLSKNSPGLREQPLLCRYPDHLKFSRCSLLLNIILPDPIRGGSCSKPVQMRWVFTNQVLWKSLTYC